MPIVSTKGLTPKQSALTERELKHLLRRTTFGLSREHFAHYQNRTLNSVVDELLTHTPEFEQPLNFDPNFNGYSNEDVYGSTWVNNTLYAGTRSTNRYSFWSNLVQKHLKSKDITEKMTLFFHHFIPTGIEDYYEGIRYWNYRYLRDNCLGNFKTIIKKTSVNSAMLFYLNGKDNKVGAPDENYARELLELFTLGKNYSPIYSESDIKEAAKILTGYTYSHIRGYDYIFTSSNHDSTDKSFSSFFDNKVIKGKSGVNGEKELDELIDMIFEKEEVSIYFATRLYRFFVYYEIDSVVKEQIIKPLAKILRDNNYEVKPVLEALFKSEHFYDSNTLGSHIKNPLDLIYGLAKEFDYTPYYVGLYQKYLTYLNDFKHKINELGMFLYEPPDVSGWKAYYQEPLMYENWISTDSILKRIEHMIKFFNLVESGNKIDVIKSTSSFSNPSNINALIDDVLEWYLTIEPSNDVKIYMKSILLYGQIEDHYWTDLWNTYTANPWDNKVKKQLESILKEFYEFLVSLPEYQLM